jgi:hypothetical protein
VIVGKVYNRSVDERRRGFGAVRTAEKLLERACYDIDRELFRWERDVANGKSHR